MELMVKWEHNGEDELESASLYNVCEWFIETYPDDIFVSKTHPVHKIRDLCKEMLRLRREVIEE